MSDNKKIYISGRITGIPIEEAKKEFSLAEKYLKRWGYEPINPFDKGLPENSTWEQHMIKDIELLFGCSAIFMLSNWNESKGAAIEHFIAHKMGMKIHYNKLNNIKNY